MSLQWRHTLFLSNKTSQQQATMKEKAKQEAMRFSTFLAHKLHQLGMKTRTTEQELGITNGTLCKNTER